jgi:S1-C subfamily serine protease
VTRLTKLKSDLPIGSATGFFYLSEAGKNYLVTSRHVVSRNSPDAIEAELHSDSRKSSSSELVTIPLFDSDGRQMWIGHPTLGAKADVAAIEISKVVKPTHFFQPITRQNFLPLTMTRLPMGENVMVIGYPEGFYDDVHKLPILKSGTIATAFPTQFRRQPYFLIDARLDEGNSGSPVFTKPRSSIQMNDGLVQHLNTSIFHFVGIASSNIPDSIIPNKKTSMDLSQVFYWWLLSEMFGDRLY